MFLSSRDLIVVLEKLVKAIGSKAPTSILEEISAALLSKPLSFQVDSDSIDFFSGTTKDDFFIRYLKYKVKNDPNFNYPLVSKISFNSKSKNIIFEFLDGSSTTRKATEVEFSLSSDGETFFENLL